MPFESERLPQQEFSGAARGLTDPQADHALRRSEERFRNLAAAAFEGLGISEGGKIIDVNDQLAQMLGYTREELLGQQVSLMVAPESRKDVADAMSQGREGPYEHLALRKDRTVFEAEVRAKTILWGGRLVRVTAVRDITERKRAARALQRQLAFNEVLNKILSGFAICAAPQVDAAVVDALQAIAQFIGVDHAYVIIIPPHRSGWSGTHEWCRPSVRPKLQKYQHLPMGTKPWSEARVLAGETIRINTLSDYPEDAQRERQMDAAEGALSVLSVVIRGSAGKVTGCVGLHSHARPVTWSDADIVHLKMVGDAIASLLERQRTEQALRESEQRYRAVVEFSPEAIAVAVDERLVYVNPACAKLLGAAEGQAGLLGRSVYDFAWPEGVEQIKARRREVLERGIVVPPIEGPLRRLDGSSVMAEGYSAPFVYSGGPAILTLIRDITARKQAEKSLRELSHRLHRAQDAERRRIARELHDSTAQQLAAAMMNLGLLEDGISRPTKKVVKLLQESLELIERCSQEVRTLSHLLHPPLLDQMGLETALRSYVEGFAQRSGIKVDLTMDPGQERFPDEIELTLFRAVQEGLGNIHRHSGSPTARIRLARTANDLILEIGDQGSGLPAETLRAIQTGSPSRGVGLAAMHERLREAGGRLEIDSTSAGTALRAIVPLPAHR
jgi:PAS domain S-box-containing protein